MLDHQHSKAQHAHGCSCCMLEHQIKACTPTCHSGHASVQPAYGGHVVEHLADICVAAGHLGGTRASWGTRGASASLITGLVHAASCDVIKRQPAYVKLTAGAVSEGTAPHTASSWLPDRDTPLSQYSRSQPSPTWNQVGGTQIMTDLAQVRAGNPPNGRP